MQQEKMQNKRNTPLMRLANILASLVLVLNLFPAQGLAEARDEFVSLVGTTTETAQPAEAANTAAQETGESEDTGKPEQPSTASSDEPESGEPAEEPAATGDDAAQALQETEPAADPEPQQGEESAATPESKSLRDFVTAASIDDAQVNGEGQLVVSADEQYTARLTFTERADLQFANTEELTLELPAGFVPAADQPAAHEALIVTYVDDDGLRQPVELGRDCWWVEGTTIHLVWRVRDAENRSQEDVAQAFQTIYAFTEMQFELVVVGSFTAGTESVDFGNGALAVQVASEGEPQEGQEPDAQPADNKTSEGEPAPAPANQQKGEKDSQKEGATEFTYEDASLMVTATLSQPGTIPADAQLRVTPVAQNSKNFSAYLSALNGASDASYTQANTLLYDVAFVKGGVELQPQEGTVSVSFRFKKHQLATGINAPRLAKVEVNHLPLVNGTPAVEQLDAAVSVYRETATFTTNGFSVFAFSYTVDFTYDGYTYVLPGNGTASVSSLLSALHIPESVVNVASVTFSNPVLLSVQKNALNSDWTLTSLQSFTTPETLTIAFNSGATYLISVTDPVVQAAPVTDGNGGLSNVVKSVSISASDGKGGKDYTLMKGESYHISIAFAETAAYEFQNDNTPMAYQIPADFKAKDTDGPATFTIRVTDTDGQVYEITGNKYEINNNVLTVKLNKDDTDFPKLSASSNARFSVNFEAEYNGDGGEIDFGGGEKKTVDLDTTSEVATQKYATVDLTNKKVYYNVTVTSTGHSDDVKIKDTISLKDKDGSALDNNGLLTLDSDSFGIKRSTNADPYTAVPVSPTVNGNSFEYTVGSMANGEVVTLTYSATIDPSKIPVDSDTHNPQIVVSNNKVEVNNQKIPEPVTSEVNTRMDYTPKIAKDGMTINEDGTEFSCRYTFNQDALVTGANRTMTDTLGDYLTLDGTTGITVTVLDSAGATVRTDTLNWGDSDSAKGTVTKSDDNKSFTYTTPNDGGNYKYVVEYKAKVTGTSGLNTQTTVSNTVKVKDGGESTGTGVITPAKEDTLQLYKRADEIDYTNKTISWTATIVVPKAGLTTAQVVDTLPGGDWYNGSQLYDSLVTSADVNDSVTVTGLRGTDSYAVTNSPDSHSFTIDFYKDGNTSTPGLTGNETSSYVVTISYKTAINEMWLKLAAVDSWRQGHTNNIALTGTSTTASATATVAGVGVTKTFKQAGTRTVNGVVLPVYKYELELRNVTQADNVIEDTFDTSILMPFVPTGSDTWSGDSQSWFAWHTMNASYGDRSVEPVTYVSTVTGMKIITNEDSMVVDSSSTTGFHPVTKIIYYLTVKDEAALKKLQARAIAADGTQTLHNVASWENDNDPADVTYRYPGLIKTLLTSTDDLTKEDQDINAQFQIEVNPGAATLNGGEPMTLTDTLTNLSVDIRNISITYPNGSAVEGIIYDMAGDVLTFQNVPDATHLIITYTARVKFSSIGNAGETVEVNFGNEASMNGYSDEAHGTARRKNNGVGAAENYSVNLMKYEAGNMNNKLEGAVFALYHGKADSSAAIGYVIDENNPVVNKSGEPVTFTTNGKGLINVSGAQDTDGWSIQANTYYFLKETKAPNNYALANFDYAFMVSEDGTTDYDKFQYHSGDTMSAKNYRGTDLHVVKEWAAGYTPASDMTVKVQLQQKIGNDGEWRNTIRTRDVTKANDPWKDVEGVYLTLSSENNWQGDFRALPLSVPKDLSNPNGEDVTVQYQVREVQIGTETADTVENKVAADGNSASFHWSYNTQGTTTTITNTPSSGALKFKKKVTLNGADTTDAQLNGIYTFNIEGVAGTETAGIQKSVAVTIEGGQITKAESVDGNATCEIVDGYVQISDLNIGNYTIKEVAPTNGVTLTSATGGTDVSNGAVTVAVKSGDTVDASGTAEFTNNLGFGSLRLGKFVQQNGTDTTSTGPNGDYTFTVTGPAGASDPVTKTVVLKVREGAVTGATVDGVKAEVSSDKRYVELTGLIAGDYTVTEVTPTNESYLAKSVVTPADGGTVIENNEATRTVTVVQNKTADASPQVAFTNNIEVGSLKIKKTVTVNGVPSKNTGDTIKMTDTVYEDENNVEVKKPYTFQIRKGTNDTSSDPLIRVELTFENGIATGGRYEIYSERVPEYDSEGKQTKAGIQWYKLTSDQFTPEGEVQIDGLTPGDYVIHEVENKLPDGVYLVGGNAQGGNDQEVTVTANNATSIPTASFTNNREVYGELALSKELVSHSPSLTNDVPFTFTVTLYKDAAHTQKATDISGNRGDMNFTDGVATVTLIGGQTKTASSIPTGLYYTITEASAAGFSLTGVTVNGADSAVVDPAAGTITTTKSQVQFTNTYNEGNLEVKKKVESNFDADKSKEFNFTVTLTDSTLTGTYGNMTFSNGVASFKLKDGESRKALNLPAGQGYTVQETSETGFSTTWTGNTSGTIETGTDAEVAATNTRQYGDLELNKTIVSALADDQNTTFTFTVTLSDKTINGTFADGTRTGSVTPMTFANGVAQVQIDGNTTAYAHNLPAGITYDINEASADHFVLSGSTNASGDITAGTTAQASFTNAKNDGSLRISKSLSSATSSDADKYFPFKVELSDKTVSGQRGKLTFSQGVAYAFLKDKQAVSVEHIDVGVTYTVTELNKAITAENEEIQAHLPQDVTMGDVASLANYTTTVNDSLNTGVVTTGSISETTSVARYTNTHQTGKLTVSKALVSDAAADKNKEFTFHVKVYSSYTNATTNTVDTSINGTFGGMSFQNGEAIVTVKAGASVTASGLPVGLYYTVTEDNLEGFSLTGVTVDGGDKDAQATQGQGTISATESKVQIENTRAVGNLAVSKALVSDASADANKEFSFTVTLSDDSISKSYEVSGGSSGETIAFNKGVGTLTVKASQTKTIKGLPTGVSYRVTEAGTPGFTLNGATGDTSTISTSTSTAEFQNKRDVGKLTVSKTLVSDAAADKSQVFEFTVKLYKTYTDSTKEVDTAITNKTYGGVTFTDGVGTFTLKGGDTKTLDGLPIGIAYTVTEASATGFTLTSVTGTGADLVDGGTTTGKSGAISATESTATFTNTRDKGSLTLSKKLVSELNADANKTFQFKVKLDDNTINKTYSEVKFTGGEATVTLVGGQSKTIEGLPVGLGYTVTEDSVEGFSSTGNAATGTITSTGSTAQITNTRNTGGFSFSKVATGTDLNANQEFTFTIALDGVALDSSANYGSYSVDGSAATQTISFTNGTATIKLKSGGYAELQNLPLGAKYTVTEAPAAGFTTTTGAADASSRFGAAQTTDDGSTYVEGKVSAKEAGAAHEYVGPTFTNTHSEGALQVKKAVNSTYAPDKTKEYSFRVELSDKSLTTKGKSAFAKIGGTDKLIEFESGVASFTLTNGQTASVTGLPAGVTYTVTETTAEGMVTTWADVVTDGGTGSKAVGTAGKGTIVKDETATTTATNTRQYGKLDVSKTVVSHTPSDLEAPYTFTVTFYTDADCTVAATDVAGTYKIGEATTNFPNGTATFTLTNGQTAAFTNVPLGLYYQVTETAVDGMVTTTKQGRSTEDKGAVAQTTTSNFTNSRTEGGLYVYKNVDSHVAADATKAFNFTVRLYTDATCTELATNINGTYGTGANAMTFLGGVATFTLKNGEFAYAMNLPVGLYYKAMEDNDEDFSINVTGGETATDAAVADDPDTTNVDESSPARTGGTGQISSGNQEVHIKNTRKSASLEVKKVLETGAADTTTDFSFVVELADKSINGDFAGMTFVNGVANFTLKKGESKTAEGLPAGMRYRVTEVNAGNYIISWDQTTYANDTAHAAPANKVPTTYAYQIKQRWNTQASEDGTTYTPQSETKTITWDSGVRTFTNSSFGYGTGSGELSSWAKENASTEWAWYADNATDLQIAALTEGKTDTVAFTNTPDRGSLQLFKTTHAALTEDVQKTFHYSVQFQDNVADGVYGEMYVENGVAYRLNGTAKGSEGFDLKSGDTISATGLPKGARYTVTETPSAEFSGVAYSTSGRVGYSSDGKELVGDAVRGSGAIDARAKSGYHNYRKSGQLMVYKSVESELPADKTATYQFQVELTDATDYAATLYALKAGASGGYELDTTKSITFTAGKSSEFTLADGESVYFYNGDPTADANFSIETGQVVYVPTTTDGSSVKIAPELGLPTNKAYTVTETTPDGMTASWTGKTGTLSDTAAAARCTNTRNKGNLAVGKEVVSDAAADKSQIFNFTVTLYSDADHQNKLTTFNDRHGDMLFNKGVASVVLMSGQTATATGLPEGVYYTVTEEVSAGFVTKSESTDANAADFSEQKTSDGITTTWNGKAGQIATNATPKVSFTNTRMLGRMGVMKTVTSAATADKNQEFTFTVRLADSSIDKTYDTTASGDKPLAFHNGVATVKLKDGEKATAENLPIGMTYTVTEDDAAGYTLGGSVSGQSANTVQTNAETLGMVNIRQVGGLTVQKSFDSSYTPSSEDAFQFTVKLYSSYAEGAENNVVDTGINGDYGNMTFSQGVATVTLNQGNGFSATATDLPTGLYYTVEENMTTEQQYNFRQGNVTGQVGQITGSELTASFTNERIYRGDLLVKKLVDTPVDEDDKQDFTLRVTLYADTGLTNRATDISGTYDVVSEGDKQLEFNSGIAVVTLKAGEQASARLLPRGYGYKVEEIQEAGSPANIFTPSYDYYLGATKLDDNANHAISDGALSKAEVTNKRDLTFATVKKDWDFGEASYKSGLPASLTVDLMRSDDASTPYATVELNAANSWTATVSSLPKKNYDGSDFVYTWKEESLPDGWTAEGTGEITADLGGEDASTLTNKRDLGSLKVTKRVQNADDLTDEEKAAITFEVKDASGTVVATHSLAEFTQGADDEEPSWTIEGLPTGTYTVTEAIGAAAQREGCTITTTYSVAGGKTQVAKDEQAEVEVTNTYLGSLNITKNVTYQGAETTGTEADGDYAFTVTQVKDVAGNEVAKAEAKDVTLTVKDGKSTTVAVEGLEPGTYVVSEVAPANGTYLVSDNDLEVEVSTATSAKVQTASFTNNKAGTPSFEKKIQDVNDTTGETSGWQDSADYDIGDAVPYRLTATLPNDVTDYRKYHLTFTDVMEESLTFNEVSKVVVAGKEVSAQNYTLKSADDQHFSLRLDWGDGEDLIADEALNGAVVEVYFTATLNAKAKLGAEGNVNACKLAFSNNPTDFTGEQEGELAWDYVIAFTYRLDIAKVDQNGKALTGAKFSLKKQLKDGSAKEVALTTSGNVFTATGLDDGTYVLSETEAPSGYTKAADMTFVVTAGHAEAWDYTSAAAQDPAFSPDGRGGILTKLTGETKSGELTLKADDKLQGLSGNVKNTLVPATTKTTMASTGDSLTTLPAVVLATVGCLVLASGLAFRRRRRA